MFPGRGARRGAPLSLLLGNSLTIHFFADKMAPKQAGPCFSPAKAVEDRSRTPDEELVGPNGRQRWKERSSQSTKSLSSRNERHVVGRGGTAVVEGGRGANLEKEEDEHDTSGQHEKHTEKSRRLEKEDCGGEPDYTRARESSDPNHYRSSGGSRPSDGLN